jgi:putative DNA primase/helicase
MPVGNSPARDGAFPSASRGHFGRPRPGLFMEAIMEAKEVKAAAHGRWGGILSALAPQLQPALDRVGHHVSCPVHGGKDGYRVFNDVDDSGGGVCNTCGVHPDGFATLMWVSGMDFKEALKSVAEYLRVGIIARPFGGRTISRQTRKGDDDEKSRQALNRVWNESIALSHSDAEPARLYLARRGISIRQPETLRLHSSLAYFEDRKEIGTFPAMLAMVQGHGGNAITIHRTYLTADGYKAPVESPRKLMRYPSQRKLSGGVIRLVEAGAVLAVAEGLETALAVMEGTKMPVWCAVNAYLLEHFYPPPGVSQILVFADKDRPSAQHPRGHGQESARRLVQRLWERGIKASAIVPAGEIPAGQRSLDWLDILNRDGKAGFPSLQSVEHAMRRVA